MSDAPEDKPKAKPRISFLGLEAIARDPANYESQGVAEVVAASKMIQNGSSLNGYTRTYHCGWRIIGFVDSYEDISHSQKSELDDLNDLLEKHDLYLTNLQFKSEKRFDYGVFGELYARKKTPGAVAVTDIQVGEVKP